MSHSHRLNRFYHKLILTLILFIPFVVFFILYVQAEKQIDRANDLRHISFLLAGELRQSSDDLTRLARTYVITGEPNYKKQYQDILNIRDGKKPRTEGVDRIYWDLVLPGGKAPRSDSALSIPLLELMRKSGFSAQELAKLTEAKEKSDQLAKLELEAMLLAESVGADSGADKARAQLIMHDRQYHESKAEIMRPIDDFLLMVDKRTEDAVHNAEKNAFSMRAVFISFTLWLIFMLWRTYKTMHNILGGSPDDVFSHIARIGSGDFSVAIPVSDNPVPSVMKSLAETQNKLSITAYERAKSERIQSQFLAIVQSSTDAIIGKTLTGVVSSWNPAAEKMFGYTEQEMVGNRMTHLLPSDRSDEELQILTRIQQGESIEHFETIRIRKNGDHFHVSVTISPIKDSSGTIVGISKIVRDITERKRAETFRTMGQNILLVLNEKKDLQEAIQKVIALIKSAAEVDAVGIRLQDNEDYPYFYQEGFPRDFLQKENSLLSRHRDGGICRDDCGHVCLECTCGLVITGKTDPGSPLFTKGGSSWTNDSFPFLHVPAEDDPRTNPRNECIHQGFASVALIPIRAKGSIVGLLQLNDHRKDRFTLKTIEILEDIAENIGEAMLRKQAEEKLITSERFLRTLTDNIPGMVGYWTRDLRCNFANKAYLEWFNKTPEKMLGISIQELMGEGLFRKNEPYILNVLQGEAQHFERELIKPNGETGATWAHYIPDLVDGSVRGFYVLVSDVTELKRAEEEKDKLVAQLRQSQKMEAIGQLAGGVAHDFNNILTVISGYCSLIQMDGKLDAHQSEQIEQIENAAEKAAQLTRGLLAFSRNQVMVTKSADLNEIVRHVQKFLNRVIGEDIQLNTICHSTKLPVNVDCGQIEQVMINLATNARDAMPGGGHLTIETSLQKIEPEPEKVLGLGQAGDYACIIISDTGTGMDEETLGKIFEPFFTTKEVGKGTGLGMAIVYGVVKQHNGFINAYSEPGHGTTFKVYIPLAVTDREEHLTEAAREIPQGGSEIILFAEDDAAVRNLTVSVLTKFGYTVIQAENGAEAIDKFAEHRELIGMVLMDMIMPIKNGKEAYEAICKIKRDVKVLFLSGYTADFIQQRGVLEGSLELVMKPVQPMELLRKVRNMLDS